MGGVETGGLSAHINGVFERLWKVRIATRGKTPQRRRHLHYCNFRANVRGSGVMVNPFDLKTALLAKPAQLVVLIHFPIALFLAAVAFDLIALWTKRRGLAGAAYFNLLAAAISEIGR